MSDKEMKKEDEPHYLEHRKRLREKFLNAPNILFEYELLELFLGYSVQRKDTKNLAKTLLNQNNNSLLGILSNASNLKGLTDYQRTHFMLLHEFYKRIYSEKITSAQQLTSVKDLCDFLKITFLGMKKEQVLIIYLNNKCGIIDHEILWEGTVDSATIYTREILVKTLSNHASSIILAHNHPSGDFMPSVDDFLATERVRLALHTIGVQLVDHVVVGHNSTYSILKKCVIGNKN